MTVSWTAPSETPASIVTAFTLYQATGSTCSGGSTTGEGTSLSASITGLTAATEYTFEVSATDSSGTSAYSACESFYTVPSAPTGLTETVGAPTTTTVIQMSWTAPSGTVSSYTALDDAAVNTCTGASFTSYASGISGSPYTTSTLGTGEGYCFEIEAVTSPGGGTGAASTATEMATIAGAPTGLTYVSSTTSSITLSWTAPSTTPVSGIVTSYTIKSAAYSGSCGSYGGPETLTSGSAYTGLAAGTSYCFEVAAVDAGGTSAYSTAITNEFTLDNAPTSLVVSPQPGTTSQFNLKWTLPTPGTIVNQTLARWTGASCGGAGGAFTNVADPTATTAVMAGLSSNTEYCFEVAAWDSAGMSAWSVAATGTTFSTPGAPTGLGVTSSTSYTVTLGWTNPAGTLVNDTVYYQVGGCSGPVTGTSVGVVTSATIYSLSPYTTYCFSVAAWTAAGAGPDSGTASTTTPAGVPGAPTAFQVVNTVATSNAGVDTINFQWTNPVAETGSLINATFYWGSLCGTVSGNGPGTWPGGSAFYISLGSAVTSYAMTGLPALTTYCYSVTLWTQAGQGAEATALSVQSGVAADPAPSNLTYGSAGQTTVTLTWSQTATQPIVNDTIAYTTTFACTSGLTFVSTGGPVITFTATGLTAAMTYYWEVDAWDSAGPSPWSSCITGATQGATPPMPYNVGAQRVGATSVYVTWTNPAGYMLIDNFVNVSTTADVCGTWSQTANLGEVTTSYLITGLVVGATYCIQVTAVDAGSPPVTISVTVTVPVTIGAAIGGPAPAQVPAPPPQPPSPAAARRADGA
jgi:hypothetical protein